MVLPGSNPDLVGAPVVPDTGWFNQKKEGGHSSNKGMYGVYYISMCIKHVALS